MVDLDVRWRLHPQVAVRPEPFGALLYHFGTRKLSFVKSVGVVEVVTALGEHPTARDALRAAGVEDDVTYRKAIATLAESRMLVRAP